MKQTENEKMTAYNRINYVIAAVDIILLGYVIYLLVNIFGGE
jgi:hypothetical protein